MGIYSISVQVPRGFDPEEFRAVLIHRDAANQVDAAGKFDQNGVLPLDATDTLPGNGTLYIFGPAKPGGSENFSHFERVEMAGSGEIDFVISDCSGTVRGGKDKSKPDVEAEFPDAEALDPASPATLDFAQPGLGNPVKINLGCVPVQMRVLDEGGSARGHGYVFQFLFNGTEGYITDPILVEPGGEHIIYLPSSSAPFRCDYWKADASGQKASLSGQTRIYLRRYGQPMGAFIAIASGQDVKAPSYCRELVPIELSGFNNIAPYMSQTNKDVSAAIRAKNKQAISIGNTWLAQNHSDAIQARVLALYDAQRESHFVLSETGYYMWGAHHWHDGEQLDGGLINEDRRITHVLVEWVE